MPEITALIDPETGALTIEGLSVDDALTMLDETHDAPVEVNCGRPVNGVMPLDPSYWAVGGLSATKLRLARVYHGSVVDGPGKRSVIQMQGCPIRCVGCYIPWTHDENGGVEATVDRVLEAVMSERHDGVTIMGGEPFAQPEALSELVGFLKMMDQHVLVYTGFTVENLKRRRNRDIDEVLRLADMVIDGPFIRSRHEGAGEWRGSTNQRVLTREEVARL